MSDLEVSDAYANREQAFVKHQVLSHYLERLFMILGLSRNEITYVDCFAGPWQDDSPDLESSSIGISIKAMRKCQEGLAARNRSVKFKAVYIEKDPVAFEKLEDFLGTVQDVETTALNGEFADLIPEISRLTMGAGFTFYFIDPKGWKDVGESTLAPLLRKREAEFLINLMYDFVNRAVSQDALSEVVGDIFGQLPELSTVPEKRRSQLVRSYRENLKRLRRPIESWTAQVPVYRPTSNRPLYYLIYSTANPKGIEIFADASSSFRDDNYRARITARTRKNELSSGVGDLFDNDLGVRVSIPADEESVEKAAIHWLGKLDRVGSTFGLRELANFVDETDFALDEIQKGFELLVSRGMAKNLDQKGRRTKNFVNFVKSEKLVRLG